MDDLIDQVTKKMANLSGIMDKLTPSVTMAQNHSEELRRQADELEKLLTDFEFANKAVNASQRYADIARALKDALAIAKEADDVAMDARDKVLLFVVYFRPSCRVAIIVTQALRIRLQIYMYTSSQLAASMETCAPLYLLSGCVGDMLPSMSFPTVCYKFLSIPVPKTEELQDNPLVYFS